MINNYTIKKINNEEILFLFFDLDTEFTKDNLKYKNIQSYIKKFIKDNKITFAGTSAVIVVGGAILGNIILNKNYDSDNYNTYAFNDGYQEIISNIPSNLNMNDFVVQKEYDFQEIIDTKENIIDNINEEVINEVSHNTINETNKINSPKEIVNDVKENIDVIENNTQEETVMEYTNTYEEEDTNTYATIQRSNGQMVTLELEEYITGVVAAEMPALFHPEALKAQAIIARTYSLKAMSKGKLLTDNNSTQNYKDNEQLKNMWGGNFNTYYNKVKDAVSNTKGMYLTYNGSYIEAVYHSTSNGKTENSIYGWGNYYPYLVSVDSQYDSLNPSFSVSTTMSYEKLSTLLGMEINSTTEFNITERTDGDRVKTILVNDKSYTGTNFRNILALRSADFDIEKNDDGIIFTTRGYGHGVGMSQYGANGMAKNGSSYRDILSHYYPGTVIGS